MIKKIIIQNLVDLSFEQSYDYNYVPKTYLVSVKLYCQIKVHQHRTFLIYHITSKSKISQQMVSTLQICQIMQNSKNFTFNINITLFAFAKS
jgi:hypothetical protein